MEKVESGFTKWFEELKENPLWWMRMEEMFGRKDLNKIASEVHLYLLASPERLKANDFSDFRRLFQTWAQKAPDQAAKPQLQQTDNCVPDNGWKPVSWEKRAEYLNQIQEILKSSTMVNAMPPMSKKEILEQGDWIPKKGEWSPPSEVQKIINLKESKRRIRECRKKVFLDAFPDATDEEIRAYWEKFEDTKEDAI